MLDIEKSENKRKLRQSILNICASIIFHISGISITIISKYNYSTLGQKKVALPFFSSKKGS